MRWQNYVASNFNVKEIFFIVERMDDCECSIEIIIVPSKEGIAGNKIFLK